MFKFLRTTTIDPVVISNSVDTSIIWNKTPIHKRENGWINATEMCKANGKVWSEFLRTERCKTYLDALAKLREIPIVYLYEATEGRNGETWIDPDLATELARWISPEFSVFVNQSFRKAYENKEKVLPGTLQEDLDKAKSLANLVDFAGGSKKDSVALSLTVLSTKHPQDRKLLLDNQRLLSPSEDEFGNVTIVKERVESELSTPIFRKVLDNMKRLGHIQRREGVHAINVLLEKMGLQWQKRGETATNESKWNTTKEGQEFGKIENRPALHTDEYRIAPQLMWRIEPVSIEICKFIRNNDNNLLNGVY
jgi:hypothetical protein